jgi:hypothetical protein
MNQTPAEAEKEEENGSSPVGRGGAGTYIEGELGAFYLLQMLACSEARGLPDAQIESVQFQGVNDGYALDDLIIHGVSNKGTSLLEIQSKRTITFAPKDGIFQSVCEQIARSAPANTPTDRHLFAAATQRTSFAISGPYQDALEWARQNKTGGEFFKRLKLKGVASDSMRSFIQTFRDHLVAHGVAEEDEIIWSIICRFLILEFDFESGAPQARAHALTIAAQVLAPGDAERTKALWSKLVELAIHTGKAGGSITRDKLAETLTARGFHLSGKQDFALARARLAEMSRFALMDIGTSVGGITLPRLGALAAVEEARDKHRFVEVTGKPGVGKSWVLRHLAERQRRETHVVVLDPIGTPDGGWSALAQRLAIPGTAKDFLGDLAASGGGILFIDGLEMFVTPERRRTVNDLLREVAGIDGFSVIISRRPDLGVQGYGWLAEDAIAILGAPHQVLVSELDDDEVAVLSELAPELRILLSPNHPAAAIARNLYRLTQLLKVPSTVDIRTEAALACNWWNTADGTKPEHVRAAQRVLTDLAEAALAGSDTIDAPTDSPGRDHLLRSLTLSEPKRDKLAFYHDVLRDWAIGARLHEDSTLLDGMDLTVPPSPRLVRGIEFAARLALETSGDCASWLSLLDRLSPVGAHSSWRRQALLAIVRSEVSHELLERDSKALLARGGALFAELVTVIAAVDTISMVEFYTSLGLEIDKPIPTTMRANTSGTGVVLLKWLLAHSKELPLQAISAAVELVTIQFHLFQMLPNFASQTAAMLFDWLRQLDIQEAAITIPNDESAERLESSVRRRMIEDLRAMALVLSAHSPEDAKAYLREIDADRDSYKVKAIRQFSAVVAQVAPAELADLVVGSLIKRPRRRGSSSGIFDRRAFSFADSDYLPPSPAQPPFLDLLIASPDHGLALVRRLVTEAVEFNTRGADPGEDGLTVVFDSGPRFFPWIQTYFWSRDQAHEYSAASGLKALEAWSHRRRDAGEPVDAVLADILGPDGSCAAYLLVAVDLLLSHFPATRSELVPFLASPELLAIERTRSAIDQMDSGALIVGNEPTGKVTLADLRAKPSRQASLEGALPASLSNDADAEKLRNRLAQAVAELDSYQDHADFADPEFMGRYALNLVNPENWVEVEGGRAYKSPSDEAGHLKRLYAERGQLVRHSEIEARIRLAIDGKEHATPDTARDAVEFAGGGLPDNTDTDSLKSRSTRLIATSLLVARDGSDDLLDEHEVWVRKVIALALAEEADRYSGSSDNVRFNRPALGALALLHLWRRRNLTADRDALVSIAARRDRAGVPAFAVALPIIMEQDSRLLKAAMRAAFAGYVWRWHPHDEDEAVRKRFETVSEATVTAAVEAETAWLDGGVEPAWPDFPNEQPIVRTPHRILVPGKTRPALNEDCAEALADDCAAIHVDSQAAAQWLQMLSSPATKNIRWAEEIVTTYSGWSGRTNGAGLPSDTELDRSPSEWNVQFYTLFAAVVLDAGPNQFDNLVNQVENLPDQSFADVAETLLHAADVLYFNDATRQAQPAVELRARMAARAMSLPRWRNNYSPGDLSIDFDTGGVAAKLLLNTHDPFNDTRSYLVPAVADRLDPLLESMRPLLPGGPTTFVALCTMNMLLVAPRTRHLDFLLSGVEAWFERLPSDVGLWVTMGIGRKVVEWFEAAAVEEPALFGPAHPHRVRIDRVFGQMVAVGVAEAHLLEKQVESAATLIVEGSA